MKKMTRREILRQLAGISVLGAVATGVRAAVNGSQPESHLFSIPSRSTSTRPRPLTDTSAAHGTSTTTAHAHHAAETTGVLETTAAPADTTGTSAQTTTSSSPATTASPAANATTTSAPPQVAVGTSQLSGVLGPTTIGAGSVATIVGDIELRGDLVVEGLLTSIDTFTLRGNGFQIEVRNGGQLDLRGIPKSGWVRGAAANGWKAGDRILTAPVEPGRYALSDFHTGSPGTVTMADGRTIAAEQFNLTRSITIDNVSRIMFHMGAGRQVLKHLSVRTPASPESSPSIRSTFISMETALGVPSSKGSWSRTGASTPSCPTPPHGITFLDCVAFNTSGEAFWWDPPPGRNDSTNDYHDIVWQHCLAAFVTRQPDQAQADDCILPRQGTGNRCVDCTAVGVKGGMQTSGFHWPEGAAGSGSFGIACAHNNAATGFSSGRTMRTCTSSRTSSPIESVRPESSTAPTRTTTSIRTPSLQMPNGGGKATRCFSKFRTPLAVSRDSEQQPVSDRRAQIDRFLSCLLSIVPFHRCHLSRTR